MSEKDHAKLRHDCMARPFRYKVRLFIGTREFVATTQKYLHALIIWIFIVQILTYVNFNGSNLFCRYYYYYFFFYKTKFNRWDQYVSIFKRWTCHVIHVIRVDLDVFGHITTITVLTGVTGSGIMTTVTAMVTTDYAYYDHSTVTS